MITPTPRGRQGRGKAFSQDTYEVQKPPTGLGTALGALTGTGLTSLFGLTGPPGVLLGGLLGGLFGAFGGSAESGMRGKKKITRPTMRTSDRFSVFSG